MNTIDTSAHDLAVAIFESMMGFGWTDEYDGSREWDSSGDDARAFLTSTPDAPIVLEHPGGNTHIGWYGAGAFTDSIAWIGAGWRVSNLTPDEARARASSRAGGES
jgi:hypothetical protein